MKNKGWVSCKEKFPETQQGIEAKWYLVASTYWNEQGMAKYSKSKGWHMQCGGIRQLVIITHWMELPELPKTD